MRLWILSPIYYSLVIIPGMDHCMALHTGGGNYYFNVLYIWQECFGLDHLENLQTYPSRQIRRNKHCGGKSHN